MAIIFNRKIIVIYNYEQKLGCTLFTMHVIPKKPFFSQTLQNLQYHSITKQVLIYLINFQFIQSGWHHYFTEFH